MKKKLLNLLDTCALGEYCKAEKCTNEICNGYIPATKEFVEVYSCYINKEALQE